MFAVPGKRSADAHGRTNYTVQKITFLEWDRSLKSTELIELPTKRLPYICCYWRETVAETQYHVVFCWRWNWCQTFTVSMTSPTRVSGALGLAIVLVFSSVDRFSLAKSWKQLILIWHGRVITGLKCCPGQHFTEQGRELDTFNAVHIVTTPPKKE